MPQLGDYDRFQARIALNLVAQLRRELELADGQAEEERARIDGLLGPEAGALPIRRKALAAAIRDGRLDWRDPALWEHMRATTEAQLRIVNPRWLRHRP